MTDALKTSPMMTSIIADLKANRRPSKKKAQFDGPPEMDGHSGSDVLDNFKSSKAPKMAPEGMGDMGDTGTPGDEVHEHKEADLSMELRGLINGCTDEDVKIRANEILDELDSMLSPEVKGDEDDDSGDDDDLGATDLSNEDDDSHKAPDLGDSDDEDDDSEDHKNPFAK